MPLSTGPFGTEKNARILKYLHTPSRTEKIMAPNLFFSLKKNTELIELIFFFKEKY